MHGTPLPDYVESRDGTQAQRACVMHLVDVVEHLNQDSTLTPSFGESAQVLGGARYDYAGDRVAPLEDLVAERVIAAWPRIGEAAVQGAIDFVPEDIKKALLNRPHVSNSSMSGIFYLHSASAIRTDTVRVAR